MTEGHTVTGLRLLVALTALSTSAAVVHANGPQVGTYYLHGDHLGSATAISDRTGKVVSRTSYRPNGAPRTVSAAREAAGHVRFTGKPRERGPDLYYFGARYLDPALGRFLAPDAVRQSSSPYLYAGASPMQYVDRDGNWYTDLDRIFSRMKKEKGYTFDTARNRLRAGKYARSYATKARQYYRGKAQAYAHRMRGIERDLRELRETTNPVFGSYQLLAEVAKHARTHMLEPREPKTFLLLSPWADKHYYAVRTIKYGYRHLEALAKALIKNGDRLPEEWWEIRSQLRRLHVEAHKGWNREGDLYRTKILNSALINQKISEADTLLQNYIANFSNEAYVLNKAGRLKEAAILNNLSQEWIELQALFQKYRGKAATVDEVLMPAVENYISTQEAALGRKPRTP